MVRLFVALRPSLEQGRAMAKLQLGLPDVRWIDPADFHVTLRFVGEVAVPVAEEFSFELERVRAEPVELAQVGMGVFPPRGAPTTLWVGVEKTRALSAVARAVDRAAKRAGIAPEGRAFLPHVTLGRFVGPPPIERLHAYLKRRSLFRTEPATVSSFDLISSVLKPEGAQHLTEARYDFVMGRAASATPDLDHEWNGWS